MVAAACVSEEVWGDFTRLGGQEVVCERGVVLAESGFVDGQGKAF